MGQWDYEIIRAGILYVIVSDCVFWETNQVVDLQVFASPRVTLKPLVPSFPCFANIYVSLMEKVCDVLVIVDFIMFAFKFGCIGCVLKRYNILNVGSNLQMKVHIRIA